MTRLRLPSALGRLPAILAIALGLGLLRLGADGLGILRFDGAAALVEPTPSATPTPLPTPLPSPSPSAPGPTPLPTPTPRTAVATRVRVPALRIDLPVIRDNEGYPLCDVAMYSTLLGQPGQGRATYLSAHARAGMFYPIYERVIRRGDPDSLLGLRVLVWASDGIRFEYEIVEVRTKQRSILAALRAEGEQLWLQTSEGGPGTKGVTQVIAMPAGAPTFDPAPATPAPRPVDCE